MAQVGTSGIDATHSGIKVGILGNATSVDGTTATQIALDHSVPARYYGSTVADFVFVLPNTSTPTTIGSFSLYAGFDHLSLSSGEENRIIMEGFSSNGVKVLDYVSPQLYQPELFIQFNSVDIGRIRMTQVDGVAIDDFRFTSSSVAPEASPLALVALGGLIAVVAFRRKAMAR